MRLKSKEESSKKEMNKMANRSQILNLLLILRKLMQETSRVIKRSMMIPNRLKPSLLIIAPNPITDLIITIKSMKFRLMNLTALKKIVKLSF